MTAAGFSTKAKKLFRGRRPFPGRLLLAIFPSLALSFTLFFFGPLDLSYVSRNYVSYSAIDILPVTSMIMTAVFAVLLLGASIFGGKIHSFILSSYSGLAIAAYIQGAFLNPDLGTMDGHTINWPSFSTMMVINCAVWFLILLIPHLIHYFSSQYWRHFVVWTSAVLVIMQGVSLGMKLSDQIKYDRQQTGHYYLSNENMLKVGKKNNVVVFLLDTVSNQDITEMLGKYPDSLALLHDFSYYNNANSHYMYTVPSLINLLTGQEYDCETMHIADYMNGAWRSEEGSAFFSTLADNGYKRNVYMLLPEAADDPAVLEEAFSDLELSGKGSRMEIDRQAFVKLIKLSFYRYLPLTMKPFFVIYTSDIANLIFRNNAMESEWDFVEYMNEVPLSTGDFDKAFIFYYLQGSHLPYRMDNRGRLIHSDLEPEYLTNYSEKEDQLAGFFYLIENYIRQLKAMGLYDQTGILILSDHGNNQNREEDHQPVYFTRFPGETHAELQINSAPITIQDSFRADVTAMTGGDGSLFGILSNQVGQDTVTERWTRAYAKDDRYPELGSSYFNVMYEFRYEGDGKILMDQWTEDAYETVPMVDSYY